MIHAGLSRKHINKQVSRIVRMFAWGVAQELVSPEVAQALREVNGLHKGRNRMRETMPIQPVDDSIIDKTLRYLPPVVAATVRLQRLTGCRPEEICLLRPADVDRSGPVWAYRPSGHKTEHHGRPRVIFIGPRGQEILRPFLDRNPSDYCFSPGDAERQRHERRHAVRITPEGQGNRPGTNRRSLPTQARCTVHIGQLSPGDSSGLRNCI